MRGGEPSADYVLQGEEERPEHALAELDAILDDAVALVLVRGGRLLQRPAALERDESLEESDDGRLVVALQGHGMTRAMPTAESAQTLLGEGPSPICTDFWVHFLFGSASCIFCSSWKMCVLVWFLRCFLQLQLLLGIVF